MTPEFDIKDIHKDEMIVQKLSAGLWCEEYKIYFKETITYRSKLNFFLGGGEGRGRVRFFFEGERDERVSVF